MRNSDRTFLQSIGFQDEDKRDGLHDQACLYLTDPERVAAIVELWGRPGVVLPKALLSHPLYDGRRLLGYADVFFVTPGGKDRFCIEVKAHHVPFQRVIQQLNLYANMHNPWNMSAPGMENYNRLTIATCYPIPQAENEAYREAGFLHVQLDPIKVQEFYRAATAEKSNSPIL